MGVGRIPTQVAFIVMPVRRAEMSARGVKLKSAIHQMSLPPPFDVLASRMAPLERALLVDNADPETISSVALLDELQATLQDWPGEPGQFAQESGILTADQCSDLCSVVDGSLDDPRRLFLQRRGLADGALEFQQDLSKEQLTLLVGEEGMARLWALAERCYHEMVRPHAPVASVVPEGDGGSADASAAQLLGECWWIYVRRYSPSTRPWFGFHNDRSLLTVNVALSDDEMHEGGRLVAIACPSQGVRPCVKRFQRATGDVTAHTGKLPHAVTRMTEGHRYSLILFFGLPCASPESRELDAQHPLVFVDALAPAAHPGGAQSQASRCCTACATLLGGGMWCCAVGCDFHLCHGCRVVKSRVHAWRKSRRRAECT